MSPVTTVLDVHNDSDANEEDAGPDSPNEAEEVEILDIGTDGALTHRVTFTPRAMFSNESPQARHQRADDTENQFVDYSAAHGAAVDDHERQSLQTLASPSDEHQSDDSNAARPESPPSWYIEAELNEREWAWQQRHRQEHCSRHPVGQLRG